MIVTDVDSTFIQGEVIEMLAAAAGTASMVREITTRAMRGELDFAQSLRERVATLAGLPDSVFSDIAAGVDLTAGAAETVRVVHTQGGYFGLVSGGFHEVVDRVAEPLGIDKVLANRLEVSDGLLTGHTRGPVIDRAAKAEALTAWADEFAIPLEQVVAVGDGANDLDMMRIAGLSVAFCAKPVVLEEADAAITIPRLDMLLALLGWDTDSAESSSSTPRDTRAE
ncbi:phosphoserine phosphatase SerB [Actinobaculum sp. 352]|nr:phosphoserine phosphatase SerB [Actinobaculum sp. 313]RTE48446.1 phosphoserine phosphatase SerB [Actinobaculum sp. 352]